MLKEPFTIVEPSDCAKCRWCCVFDASDAWERPALDDAVAERFETEMLALPGGGQKRVFKMDFPTDDIPCPALGPSGCTLGELKPFDCQVWPLRPMRLGNQIALTASPNCKPSLTRPLGAFLTLAQGELGQKILDYGKAHPEELMEYLEGYPIFRVA
jgi:hypothetical protein